MTLEPDVLDERWTGLPQSLCASCRHLDLLRLSKRRCAAFPDGIADAVWDGQIEHRAPLPGDRGIQFAPRHAEDVERLEAERQRLLEASLARATRRQRVG